MELSQQERWRENTRRWRERQRAKRMPVLCPCGGTLPKRRRMYCSDPCYLKHGRPEERKRDQLRHRENINARSARYRETHREEMKAYLKKYYKKNRAEAARQSRERYLANREAKRQYDIEYKQRPEVIERYRAKLQTPEFKRRQSIQNKLRHALRRSIVGTFTKEQWLARVEAHGWRCFYCYKDLQYGGLTMDHAIPVSRGGTNWASNLLPACKSCNSKKKDRTVLEYLKLIGSRRAREISK